MDQTPLEDHEVEEVRAEMHRVLLVELPAAEIRELCSTDPEIARLGRLFSFTDTEVRERAADLIAVKYMQRTLPTNGEISADGTLRYFAERLVDALRKAHPAKA